MQRDTSKQAQLVRQAQPFPGAFSKDMIVQMSIAYRVPRSDLVGYHGMLTVWRDALPEPGVNRVIDH